LLASTVHSKKAKIVKGEAVEVVEVTAVVPDHVADIQDTTAEVTIMDTALMAIMFTTTTTDLQWLLLVAMATCWVTAIIITAILATMD